MCIYILSCPLPKHTQMELKKIAENIWIAQSTFMKTRPPLPPQTDLSQQPQTLLLRQGL